MVTRKIKVAISEFAYYWAMLDAFKTLERKLGQTQAVVTVYLNKLANVPHVKKAANSEGIITAKVPYNSEGIISYSTTVSSLTGYSGPQLQPRFVQCITARSGGPKASKEHENWSMHTVKRNLDRPTLADFNDWLEDNAEGHERMKTASEKTKVDENTQSEVTKIKTASKVFSATTLTNQQNTTKQSPTMRQQIAWHVKNTCGDVLYRKKTPTKRTKLVVDNKLCFSCFNDSHPFRQCPQPRKCTEEGCESSHKTFLHGADRNFPNKTQAPNKRSPETSTCNGTRCRANSALARTGTDNR